MASMLGPAAPPLPVRLDMSIVYRPDTISVTLAGLFVELRILPGVAFSTAEPATLLSLADACVRGAELLRHRTDGSDS